MTNCGECESCLSGQEEGTLEVLVKDDAERRTGERLAEAGVNIDENYLKWKIETDPKKKAYGAE
ncbi:hypothetical protein LCGC14_1539280, partial [marine sediment metagenome]